MKRVLFSLIAIEVSVALTDEALGADKIPLRVLYLARNESEVRTKEFLSFLSEYFEDARTVLRSEFAAENAKNFDVVILDWSQRERTNDKYDSPLGRLEDFNTPAVLLGSAGLLLAGPWNVLGGAG